MRKERVYVAIDLKSYYASVECVERGLDPLTTNLVVADESRTDKTICLAVTPSLKAYDIPGRPRLFEVIQRVKQVNAGRLRRAPGHKFTGSSSNDPELRTNPSLELSYIVAPPRMAYYMQYSARIHQVYLRYIAPEHIHVYSIDEVLMDVTDYLDLYKATPKELAMRMIRDVLQETGITATAGIGTNLYLAKVAMDIVAKHIPMDGDGVRIAELNEMSYRQLLWAHRPLTDFWRVGKGYVHKLEEHGLYTMGDIARCSLSDHGEKCLHKLFGGNAELLIDHAWGWEPCTMEAIKAYKPESNSIGAGQVLQRPYTFEEGRIICREMTELLTLDLVEKGLMTNQVVLTIGYDRESLTRPDIQYNGPTKKDHYGREVPKHAHGTANLPRYTSSTRVIMDAMLELYDRVVQPQLLVRRVNVVAAHVVAENSEPAAGMEQMDLFTDPEAKAEESTALERERRLQKAMIGIKGRFGKNAILKGTSLQKSATAMERNRQIGGHKA